MTRIVEKAEYVPDVEWLAREADLRRRVEAIFGPLEYWFVDTFRRKVDIGTRRTVRASSLTDLATIFGSEEIEILATFDQKGEPVILTTVHEPACGILDHKEPTS